MFCKPGCHPIDFLFAPTQGDVALPPVNLCTQRIVVARKPVVARVNAGIVTGDAIRVVRLSRGFDRTGSGQAETGYNGGPYGQPCKGPIKLKCSYRLAISHVPNLISKKRPFRLTT